MNPNTAVIGVGSNINPEENIRLAKEAIKSSLELLGESKFVKTEPLGYKDQDDFTNGAFLIRTQMSRAELNSWLKSLENSLGRVRTENKNSPRTIDLDILVWNGEVIDGDVAERGFLRDSISELLPDLNIAD